MQKQKPKELSNQIQWPFKKLSKSQSTIMSNPRQNCGRIVWNIYHTQYNNRGKQRSPESANCRTPESSVTQ